MNFSFVYNSNVEGTNCYICLQTKEGTTNTNYTSTVVQMQIFKLFATSKRELARSSDFSVLVAMPQLAGTEPATTITYS
jgi:hypothetical protein